jgi:hypothetical protein
MWIIFQTILLARFFASHTATLFFPHTALLNALIILIFFATNAVFAFFGGKRF